MCIFPPQVTKHQLVSDASGHWGCGALFNTLCIQWPWPENWAEVSIAPKELAPIVMAVALWGPQLAHSKVCSLCDNMAVVCTINKKSARDPRLSRLMGLLCLLCAIYDITLVAKHTPGAQNTSADALSRNQLHTFLSINPQASSIPTVIPRALQELVFSDRMLSTSKDWTTLLKSTLEAASRQPHTQHMCLPSGDLRHSDESSA